MFSELKSRCGLNSISFSPEWLWLEDSAIKIWCKANLSASANSIYSVPQRRLCKVNFSRLPSIELPIYLLIDNRMAAKNVVAFVERLLPKAFERHYAQPWMTAVLDTEVSDIELLIFRSWIVHIEGIFFTASISFTYYWLRWKRNHVNQTVIDCLRYDFFDS